MNKILKAVLMAALILMAAWGVLKTVKYPDKAPGAYTFYESLGVMSQPAITGEYCGEDGNGNCKDFSVIMSPTLADKIIPSCPNYILVNDKDAHQFSILVLKQGSCRKSGFSG